MYVKRKGMRRREVREIKSRGKGKLEEKRSLLYEEKPDLYDVSNVAISGGFVI